MSAAPDTIMRLAFEVEKAVVENARAVKAYIEARTAFDASADVQRHASDALHLARSTLMYYVEKGEMPRPRVRYLDFEFPE